MDNHLSQLKRPREAARREGASVRTPPAGAEVRVEHASRRYGSVDALVDASLHASPGEMLAITGRSGSGKSTLLHLIGGLDQPTSGRVLVDGREIWREPGSARHRRELVGFVFQQHFLLTDLVARANVEVALLGSGMRRTERRSRALELLDEVGLADRAEHRLLLADEPTGAVDSGTSQLILDLLAELRERRGMTLVIVSYDAQVGIRADRMLTVIDGRVADPD